MRRRNLAIFVVLLALLSNGYTQHYSLTQARLVYHQSVENQEVLDSALVLFNQIKSQYPSLESLCLAYIGSLTALKGKHAKMPWNKLKWVRKSLPLMDQAVQMDPENPEIRFIRGTTTFFLPSFFGKKDQSLEDFAFIISLLKNGATVQDEELLMNALEFITKNVELAPDDSLFVTNYLRQYTNAR